MQRTHHSLSYFDIDFFQKSFKFSSFVALVAVDDVLFMRQLYLMFVINGRFSCMVPVLEVRLVL